MPESAGKMNSIPDGIRVIDGHPIIEAIRPGIQTTACRWQTKRNRHRVEVWGQIILVTTNQLSEIMRHRMVMNRATTFKKSRIQK